jgi:hypothetical protein
MPKWIITVALGESAMPKLPNIDHRTLVTFLLDETGSMETIKDDTIGGFNSYLSALKELLDARARHRSGST